ncbi:hypothetical protein J6524_00175 [Bradyrhizobium sp. WSM 1738]|uniref:hypothetical protein n=1 Tax=Bradyrhizobium hereditatis TaxID=2821405 RepID=UPI001CE35DE6|nr:hypothetical protein [Bradyrhizobium hereditatis]MCA6113348.1 hypothetical protein [Bradyrhizobium hereditatis]
MTYRTTLIASLSAVALVLAAGETLANPPGAHGPGAAPGGPGAAPARPAFPAFRSMHHHHHRGGFHPGVGVFYGLPAEVERPVVEAPPIIKQSDDLRFTCVYDIPWDYVHRCPQYNTPRY